MTAYYNEIDSYCCQWLRNLINAGHLPEGDVDERDIRDVRLDDLKGYTQAHFFAGIGGWPYALRLAGWSDDRECWTGSCPCQPLSCAGQRKGHADERHLWPAFHALISECRPPIIFGEQTASRDGREWLAGVRFDLEALGYACGAADLCCAGQGAPQIRQRLYWVADAAGIGSRSTEPGDGPEETQSGRSHSTSSHRRFTDSFGNNYRIPESDVPFVAYGFPGILDQIRAFGNAIDPHLGATFIKACGAA